MRRVNRMAQPVSAAIASAIPVRAGVDEVASHTTYPVL
jgi:hypothetical protein